MSEFLAKPDEVTNKSASDGGGGPSLVTMSDLRGVMPLLDKKRAKKMLPHLNNAMVEWKITTRRRIQMFLAQLAHESVQLRYFEEIASGAAYEGRKDLGNTRKGDGKRYKGRGPIQLTGRANYRRAGKALGVNLERNPKAAATFKWGFQIAGWYWGTHPYKFNRLADTGTLAAFKKITRGINGGYNGLSDRIQYWQRAKSVIRSGGSAPAKERSRRSGLRGARLASAVRYNKARGFSRKRIKQIQRRIGVAADGVIGPATTKAVYAFQRKRSGLSNDGKLGPATLKAMRRGGAKKPSTKRKKKVRLSARMLRSALRYNRKRNFTRARIRQIQKKVGSSADGILGRNTVNAVATWQARRGLAADGKVGPATVRKMGLVKKKRRRRRRGGGGAESGGKVPKGNITANFSWREFATNDGTPVPSRYRNNARRLAAQLEKIRAAFGGRSITINSAYRHPAYNRRIGGASNSQHLYATAADFNVSGVRPSRVRQVIEGLISRGRVKQGGMGAYNSFTHYDVRGYRSRWSG